MRRRSLALALLVFVSACTHHDAPQHPYTARLHVAVARSIWRMEPAPASTKPLQTRDEAQRRAHSNAAEFHGTSARVFFGLFTGVDADGARHAASPAWLVVASGVPKLGYGVVAFSDDLTQPWVSTRLTSTSKPVVY